MIRLAPRWETRTVKALSRVNAGIAQLVEQLICNQQVVGSSPTAGSLQRKVLWF